ncbi:MAG: hypothetical protein ACI9S8_003049 [Chlamydiales bacterium]|jgi:hypothetical protein
MAFLPPLTLADLDRMPGMHHLQPKGAEAEKRVRKREREEEKEISELSKKNTIKKKKRRRKLVSRAGKNQSFGLSTCLVCKEKGDIFSDRKVKAASQKIFHRDPNMCSKCRSGMMKFVAA